MKNTLTISKIVFGAGLVLLSIYSCKNEGKQDAPTDIAVEQDTTMVKNDDVKSDAKLVMDAAEINTSQIEIGKLAQVKGASQEVRDYGKMLVADHTKALEELKVLANKNSITLPSVGSEDGTTQYNKLKEKSGVDFDKLFAETIAEEHNTSLDKMTEISQKASDSDVKLWASRQAGALTVHFEQAKKLNTKNLKY